MEDALTVRRWRRYGADRLFVTQQSGARVGSVDLQSGEVVVEDPGQEAGLRRAAQAYLRTDGRSDATELVLPVPHVAEDALDAASAAALDAWLGARSGDPDGDLELHRRGRGSSVRTRLERLTEEGWQVLHDVPLGRQGTAVEHLLVGPGGLFTVTERSHVGQRVVVDGRAMSVDGDPVAYLRVARLEAARVQGVLLAAACAGVSVRGVVVVQGELEVVGPPIPEDPLVVPRQDVPGLFRNMPHWMSPERVSAIATVARRRSTWAY